MNIKKNLCMIDRIARLSIGIACVYIGFIDTTLIANNIASFLIGIFGAVNLFAFVTSFCPVYAITGLSTIKKPVPTSET